MIEEPQLAIYLRIRAVLDGDRENVCRAAEGRERSSFAGREGAEGERGAGDFCCCFCVSAAFASALEVFFGCGGRVQNTPPFAGS